MADTYTCSSCGRTFEKEWSDEQAMQEYEEMWGNYSGETAVVCDDCWHYIMSRLASGGG